MNPRLDPLQHSPSLVFGLLPFLYLPIVLLVIFLGFTGIPVWLPSWTGFSTKWYRELSTTRA